MRIAVIGTGYVGLVSGACFSEFGTSVVCVDKAVDKIERLNRGEIPIHEPGLDALIKRNAEAGRIEFTSNQPHRTYMYRYTARVGAPRGGGGMLR